MTNLQGWSSRGRIWIEKTPVWAAGLVVALLTWQIGMNPPGPGLDASWNAGLAMAAHDGLRFGKEVVFSYGPLGFLQSRYIWFGDQGVLSFLYTGGLFVALSIGLVWALRRRLPLPASAVIAFVLLAVLPLLELSLLTSVLACVWLLERDRAGRSPDLFVIGAATLAALAALVKLSTGPLVGAVFLIALIGARQAWWRIAAYVGLLVVELLVLWLVTGQTVAGIPAFIEHTAQISSGYSSAMLRHTEVAAWKVVATTVGATAIALASVAVAWRGSYRDGRARLAAVIIVALAAFAIYKEGVVRVDAGHLTFFFANACVLWIAVGLGWVRWRLMLGVAAAIFLVSLPVRPAGAPTYFNVVSNLHFAFDQARTLVSPGRRDAVIEGGRAGMEATYQLDPAALAALQGRTVAVEPWEVGAAWAYGLAWRPLPVFQNYSAYTSSLDRLNAAMAEDPQGPERILRENQQVVLPEFPGSDLDNRYPGWDPPEQARAVLCNFAPLYTDERWQVLGRTPDRCGAPRPLRSVTAAEGEAVPVPSPGPDQVVFVRIAGAGISGLERLTTFLFHSRARHLTIDGSTRYRLVPETAGDGLLLRGGADVIEPGPFSPIPQAHSIALDGAGGNLTFSFYETTMRPVPVRSQ